MRPVRRALRTPKSPTLAAVAAVLVAAQACRGSGPAPKILSTMPASAYSDVDATLVIDVPSLRPSLLVDVESQSATFDGSSVNFWLIPSEHCPRFI